jgi:hypothetical protein
MNVCDPLCEMKETEVNQKYYVTSNNYNTAPAGFGLLGWGGFGNWEWDDSTLQQWYTSEYFPDLGITGSHSTRIIYKGIKPKPTQMPGRYLNGDGYYEIGSDRKLVIEYREMQHSEAVAFFDKRLTCSGCNRAEQRRRYDELRRKVLPQHGIRLIELDYSSLQHTTQKRLKRDTTKDEAVIRERLSEFLPPSF